MRRLSPTMIAAIVAAAVLLLVAVVLLVRGTGANQDRLSDEERETPAVEDVAERCSSQRTYDLIKRELFRQAARLRGSDQAAFDRVSAHAAVRMERPVLRSEDDALNAVGCSGLLVLDLPPGVAVVGGRRSLSAEINYLVQPAVDGSGDVVMLDGADPIIIPLATLARTPTEEPRLSPEAPPEGAFEGLNVFEPALETPTPVPEQEPAPAPQEDRSAASGPSYDCRLARTRSERAVCDSAALSALDRQMAAQYGRAMSDADMSQRRLLESTRDRFLRFREGCRSDDCITETYQGRMREISDIMAGRWRAPR